MITEQLSTLYKNYIQAFAQQDIEAVKSCYLMPCTLSTPDKVVLLNSDDVFQKEFLEIFSLLSSESISAFKTSNASFQVISEQAVVACIDWQFVTEVDEIFTEFCAIYHLIKIDNQFKIINVISQDVNQSKNLAHSLVIDMEKA